MIAADTKVIMAQALTKNNLHLIPQKADRTEAWERFESCYQSHQALVRQVLFNVCGPEELDDLVQEVWLKVWRALPKFEGRSSLKTWLYRICINVGMDHHRKRKPVTLVDQSVDEVPEMQTSNNVSEQDLIAQGMQKLSVEHRTVLTLATFEQRPLEEIAEIMDCQVGTVKSRLHYARRHLRDFLETQGVQI